MATKHFFSLVVVCGLALNVFAQTGNRTSQSLRVALRMEASTLPVTDRQVVAKAQLEKAVGLVVFMGAPEADKRLTVAGFVVSAVVNGKLLEGAAKGDALTDEQRAILSKVVPGDTVYIERIEVHDANGAPRKCATHAIVVG